MSINRNLSVSLFLSLLWHFFCIFIISIELVPERKILAGFTPLEISDSNGKTKFLTGFSDISFLGPILGEEVLISPRTLEKPQPMVRLRPSINSGLVPSEVEGRSPLALSGVEVPIGRSDNKSSWVKKTVSYEDTSPKTKLLAKNFFRDLALDSNKKETHIELSKMNLESKAIPNLFSSSGKSSIKSSESPLPLIEGPIRSRGIIYKPPLPKPKRWTERPDQYTDAELKFLVSPEGKVLYVEKVLSSGDPEVDLLWMRYIKRWRFLPEQTNINQWGKVRLNFNEH